MASDAIDQALNASGLPDRPRAIALSYANKNAAPIVVAKGYGAVADAIVQRARQRFVRARFARTGKGAHAN